MSQSAETKSKLAPQIFAWSLDYGPAVETGRQTLDQWSRGLFECAHELSLFAMARINEDFEAWRVLVNCTSVGEVVHCHHNFAQKAMEDYAAEAGRLLALMSSLAGSAFGAAAQRATAVAPSRPTQPAAAWELTPAAAPAAAAPRPAATRGRPSSGAKATVERGNSRPREP
jgi:Phasin protein